jgi:CBS domain-containing protein/sporulation protein YlmC with PRC-barrel domain
MRVEAREAFVSELCGKPVELASIGIGKLQDIAVDASEPYPPVVGVYVKVKGELRYAPAASIASLTDRKTVLTAPPLGPLEAPVSPNELLLNRELLDKQIVDVDGRKVVRVNDARLAPAGETLRLIAVDIGISGLLRRVGLRGLGQAWLERVSRRGLTPELISWDAVQPLHRDSPGAAIRLQVPSDRINRIHPSDLAAIIEELNATDQASLVGSLDEETAADAFEQLEPETQLSILEDLSPDRAADIIENMAPDDAADILAEVAPEKQEEILRLMEPDEAKDVRELLTHDEETAGGLMTTEYLSIPPGLTVGETFDRIRKAAEDAELIYYVYVLEADERLVGVVALKDLITEGREAPVSSIMVDDVVHVGLTASKEEVATTIARYDFLAVPVVDEKGLMHGIVTVDDVVDVLLPEKLRRMLSRVGKSRSKVKKAPR